MKSREQLEAEGRALLAKWRAESDADQRQWTRDVFFLVEATSFEHHCLWERWHDRIAWEQLNPGYIATVGKLAGKPVTCSVQFARIGGRIIVFYSAESQVVDHTMVEAWLWREFKPAKWDSGRQAHCDAQNFHLCAHAIQEAVSRPDAAKKEG